MSDVKRPQVKRNTKGKQATPTTEAAVEATVVSTVSTPVETHVASTEVPTPSESTTDEAVKKQKVSDILKTYISPARVRRDVDSKNLNRVNEEKTDELKAIVAEYHSFEKVAAETTSTPDDVAKATEFLTANKDKVSVAEQQLKALSKDKVRFSHAASLMMSVLCDELVRELATFAMSKTIESGKKNVYVSHVHSEGVEKLSLYALVKDLPSFVSTSQKIRAELMEEAKATEVKKLLVQAEKDFKKKYQLTKEQREKEKTAKAAEKAAEKPADKQTEPEDDEHEEDASYKYYIKKLFDGNKPNEVSLRISKEIKAYLSKLVDEFLSNLADQLRLTIINMKNKTINEVAILHTVKSMLIVNHVPQESLTFSLTEDKYEVVHTREYPSCGYSSLERTLSEKVEKFKELHATHPEVAEAVVSAQ
jgi:histone H3/H4